MNTVEFLADQLRRAHQGEAWHGPSLRETLAGVDSEMASARPVPQAHTIWELVRHVGAWVPVVGRRLDGESVELPAAEDWPAPADASEAAWQNTLAALDEETKKLQEKISKLPEESLRKGVPGANYSVRFMLEGVIQHHLYHAGQITLLKKMVSARS
ncbi:MAG TPA: DinB family protein [Bryobacteraceae bacterium]|nr:DinB family protein [Bryobacteraceae bacterium]